LTIIASYSFSLKAASSSFNLFHLLDFHQDDVAMILRLEDELREDAQDAVQSLQALGVYVAMLTGDERKAAEAVAQTLGIQERQDGHGTWE